VGLIDRGQVVEHYEKAGHGPLIIRATAADTKRVVALLWHLGEEKTTDPMQTYC